MPNQAKCNCPKDCEKIFGAVFYRFPSNRWPIRPPFANQIRHYRLVRNHISNNGPTPYPSSETLHRLGPYLNPVDPAFDAIRHEVGSSIIAPGFSATFAGNFSALDGVMGVSGVHFSGNAFAVIKGTIINYSDSPAVVEGNATLTFDRINSPRLPSLCSHCCPF